MKYYRGLLEDAGLLHPSPKRSQSESNLSAMEDENGENKTLSERPRLASASTDNVNRYLNDASPTQEMSPTSSLRSLNLSQYNDFGQTENVSELQDQVKQLKGQMQRYCRIIRNLHYRLKTQTSGSSDKFPTGSQSDEDVSPAGKKSVSAPDDHVEQKPPPGGRVRTYSDGTGSKLREEIMSLKQRLEESDSRNKSLQQRITFLSTGGKKGGLTETLPSSEIGQQIKVNSFSKVKETNCSYVYRPIST